MQAWLSVWIITLLSVGTVSKAVIIAVVSALVKESQLSIPTACQLSELEPLACIQVASIVISYCSLLYMYIDLSV